MKVAATSAPPALESLIGPAMRRDASGRDWLPALLGATAHGRGELGELVDRPGSIAMTLSVQGLNGRFACFDYPTAAPRELLAWFIDHPDQLDFAGDEDATSETMKLRRVLLSDDPPGSRARAQERAHEMLGTTSPFAPAWWRFEAAGPPECVLITERLVITVQSDITDPLAPVSPWYPARSRLVRELEAARLLAHGRRYASLLVADGPVAGPDPVPGEPPLGALVVAGTPHLDAPARAELCDAFLGRLSWERARAALSSTSN